MNDYSELRAEHRPHEERCLNDDLMWPCDVIVLLDEVERLREVLEARGRYVERLEAARNAANQELMHTIERMTAESEVLLREVERLRAGQELALGVATMVEMLLPAMREKNVELVNTLVAGLKGSGAMLEAALNSSTEVDPEHPGQQNAPVAEGDAP